MFYHQEGSSGDDEAWTLGLGNYLIKNGYREKGIIIREHMAKVMELCREEGLEPMIWSDMYFRVHSATEEYYNVPFTADLTGGERPPEGMTLVYWDYYHLDGEFYRNYIRLHRQLTEKVLFAGGGWTWNGTVPNLKGAYAAAKAALEACRAEGLKQAIFTLWGDDGTETPLTSALGPVIFWAEYGFGEGPAKEQVREKFEFLTRCSYEAYAVLGEFESMGQEMTEKLLGANPSKNLFYQDVMLGVYDGQVENVGSGGYGGRAENTKPGTYYGKLAERMAAAENAFHDPFKRPEAREDEGTSGFWERELSLVLEYYQAYARVLSQKADLGLRIRSAYKAGDQESLQVIADRELSEICREVERCRCLRRKLWENEGKIFGWEVLDIRFRALAGRLESARERIQGYLEGRISELPELEEERLPISPEDRNEQRFEVWHNSWINTVSPSPLAWGWLPQ